MFLGNWIAVIMIGILLLPWVLAAWMEYFFWVFDVCAGRR